MVMHLVPQEILRIGLTCVGFALTRQGSEAVNKRRFREHFGIGPASIPALFVDLQTTLIAAAHVPNPDLPHLLMALHWLTLCLTESAMAGVWACCETTVRDTVWCYVCKISAIQDQNVYVMRDGLCMKSDEKKFKTNLHNLRKALAKKTGKAASDRDALASHLAIHPRGANDGTRPCPRWDGSDAQRWLKHDIEQGRHKAMRPKILRQYRPEYSAFPLQVFRDHISQELRSIVETPHWMAERARKAARRAKRAGRAPLVDPPASPVV